jgi:hypothetical protein
LKARPDCAALHPPEENIRLDATAEYVADDDVGLGNLSGVDVAQQEVHGMQRPAVDVSDDCVDSPKLTPEDVADQHVDLLRGASEDVSGKNVDQRDIASLEIPDKYIASPQRAPENTPLEQIDDACRPFAEVAFAVANRGNPFPLEVALVSSRRGPDRLSLLEHLEDLIEFVLDGPGETVAQQARDRVSQSQLQEP